MVKCKKILFSIMLLLAILATFAFGMTFIHTTSATTSDAEFGIKPKAAVRLARDDSDATGIRWEATLNEAFWQELGAETAEFGSIVAPRSKIAENAELTIDTPTAKAVKCAATAPVFDENGEFTFYSSIVYDNVSAENKLASYAVDLTARAYVKVGDTYHYVDEYETTRSMRGVALSAVQTGDVDEIDVSAYYGAVTNAEGNSGYYSEADLSGVIANVNDVSGTVKAYVDAIPATVTVDGDELNLTDISGLVPQREYKLNIFQGNNVYTQSIIYATKVIDEASDLAYFKLTNINLGTTAAGYSYATEGTTEFDGYYVMTNNIDATGYTHLVTDKTQGDATMGTIKANGNVSRSKLDKISRNGSTWNVDAYAASDCGGLTGTFDGNGFTISNLTVKEHGLFGLVVGGTVKNLGLYNASLGAETTAYTDRVFIAGQVVDATFENVYIQAQSDSVRGSKAVIAMTTAGDLTMSNCLFDYDFSTVGNSWAYGLFGANQSRTGSSPVKTSFHCSDVYVRSNSAIAITLASNSFNYNASVSVAENEASNNSQAIEETAFAFFGGTVEEVDGVKTFKLNGNTYTPPANKYIFNTWNGGSVLNRISGIYRYDTQNTMIDAENSYSTFNSDMWTYGDGQIAFSSTGVELAHVVEGTYYFEGTSGTFTNIDKATIFGAANVNIIGAKYNGNELTVEDGAIEGFENVALHDGSDITLSIYADNKDLPYMVNVIPVTAIIENTNDLANTFNITNIVLDGKNAVEGTTEFGGYYVLANDIDASGYTHKVTNKGNLTDSVKWLDGSSMPYSKLEKINSNSNGNGYVRGGIATHGGLTGTFDGNGHTISGITVQGHGLFGLIVGGVVKNVGFTDVTLSSKNEYEDCALFAAQMVGATIENVYVQANDISSTSQTYSNKGLLSISAFGTNNIRNSIFDYDFADRETRKVTYGLIAGVDNNSTRGSVVGQNAYVISNSALTVRALNNLSNSTQMAVGTNEKSLSATALDQLRFNLIGGVITDNGDETYTYTLNNQSFTTASSTSIMGTNHWWADVYTGSIYRYNSIEDMEAANNSYTAFSDTYWDTTDGIPTWIIRDVKKKPSEGLLFTKIEGKEEYAVSGIGTCEDSHLVIPGMYNDLPVTQIADRAFAGNMQLVQVTIPSSITSIGNQAFQGCARLVEVCDCAGLGIEKAQTTNGYVAYYAQNVYTTATGESKIVYEDGFSIYVDEENRSVVDYDGSSTDPVVPDDVTMIGAYGIYNKNINSLTVSASVESIGYYGVAMCSNLTEITFDSDSELSEIGRYAFYQDSRLTSFQCPDNLTRIGDDAFYGCHRMMGAVLNEGLVAIGGSAFYNCYHLTDIIIPSTVQSIDSYAFYNCYNLIEVQNLSEDIELAINGTENGYLAYYAKNVYSTGLSKIEKQDGFVIYNDDTQTILVGYLGDANVLSIPSEVTVINKYSLFGLDTITELSIPTTVESMGDSSLEGCNALITLEVPFVGASRTETTNTHFGYVFGAYSAWNGQQEKVPDTLAEVSILGGTCIAEGAFRNCKNLTSVSVAQTIETIKSGAFEGCGHLTNITFENGSLLETIENYAFSDCVMLSAITIPDTVQKLGNYVFRNCTNLGEVNISQDSQLADIGNNAFYMCENLETIEIPDAVESIENYTFYGCSSLNNVTLGAGITTVGAGAFSGCSALTAMDFNGTTAAFNGIEFTAFWNDGTPLSEVSCTDGSVSID